MTTPPANAQSRFFVASPSHDGVSDDMLVAAVQGGDAGAFETMAKRYGPALCTYVYRYVRSREIAEELVQDVFLNILQQGARWTVRDTLPTYLYGAARNRAFNHLRHAAVEARWVEGTVEPSVDHTDPVESNDLMVIVRRAVNELSPRQRQVVALRWYHQLSYAEIAAITHTSTRSVETSLGRALNALRQRLDAIFL